MAALKLREYREELNEEDRVSGGWADSGRVGKRQEDTVSREKSRLACFGSVGSLLVWQQSSGSKGK